MKSLRRDLRRRNRACACHAAVIATLGLTAPAGATVSFGQIDDFANGTVMGWMEGSGSPNKPSNQPSGGPAGAGDRYLRDVSSTEEMQGSRQVMFNQSQWKGDFVANNVTRLEADMANFGTTTLNMRVTVRDFSSGFDFSSTWPAVLPPDGVWRHVTFDLSASGMSSVAGGGSLSETLAHVSEVRILSAAAAPASIGDVLDSILAMDNLRALTLPGDANFDKTTNALDFGALASHFGATGQTWNTGDFDFNGTVNTPDFNLLAQNFGNSISLAAPTVSGAAVPEPALGAFALIALLGTARNLRSTMCR
jgi:hypothetical protein